MFVTKDVHSLQKDEQLSDDALANRLADQTLVKSWLTDHAAQFTVAGLSQMHQVPREDELFIHFRNNHFAVMLKRRTYLFALVTDLGILRAAPSVVWQRVGYIDGDDTFLDCDFMVPGERAVRHPQDPRAPSVGPTVAALAPQYRSEPGRIPHPHAGRSEPKHRRGGDGSKNSSDGSCAIL